MYFELKFDFRSKHLFSTFGFFHVLASKFSIFTFVSKYSSRKSFEIIQFFSTCFKPHFFDGF
ncbi:unnamed protein product [Meloidogyne enterolobii]|uniref:Uncharacterized protein n=1 Tax=Meloidogyne enterolobii TaxID=390850 RepID=A0ACB0ZQT0_MELEN